MARLHTMRSQALAELVRVMREDVTLPCTPGQVYDAARPVAHDSRLTYAQVQRLMLTTPALFARVAPGSYTLVDQVLAEIEPPADFLEPNWDEVKRCHNWRRYVPEKLVPLWTSLPANVRAILAADYQRLASLEEWE